MMAEVHSCTYTRKVRVKNLHTHLDLHLKVGLKGGEKGEKDAERELKHLGHTRHSILAQSNTEVLLDG